MIDELLKRSYDPDPVKRWKKSHIQQMEEESQGREAQTDSDLDDDMRSEEARAEDYDYLLGMAMWSLTHERKEGLLRKKQEKKQELEILMATSKEDMWRTDLKEFVKKLDEFEQKQRDNRESAGKKVMKKKDGSRKKAALGPSPAK